MNVNWNKKQFAITVGIILLALLVIVWVRSCSKSSSEVPVYHLAYDPNWHPSQLHGKDRNMAIFAAELLTAIGHETGAKFFLSSEESGNLLGDLRHGKYDGILSYLSTSVKEEFTYSHSFYPLGPVLVVSVHSNIKSIDDLDGRLVGISAGTSLIFDIEKFPSLVLNSYRDILGGLIDLDHGTLDAVIMDSMPAEQYTHGFFANKLKIISKPLSNAGLYLITNDNEKGGKLVETFNTGLDALKNSGFYDSLLKKWDLYNTEKM